MKRFHGEWIAIQVWLQTEVVIPLTLEATDVAE
jgi:hypothetical protein